MNNFKPEVAVLSPRYEILFPDQEQANLMFRRLEYIARKCYASEDKITEDSAFKFLTMLRNNEHTAMFEHSLLTVEFTTSRGFSHELVRHRIASFAMESQRYVDYKKFLPVICPTEILNNPNAYIIWLESVLDAAEKYCILLDMGLKPQIARSVLPTCTKTEIVISANWREWRNIFQLRTSKAAHPEMRELMIPLLEDVKKLIPVIFDDIIIP